MLHNFNKFPNTRLGQLVRKSRDKTWWCDSCCRRGTVIGCKRGKRSLAWIFRCVRSIAVIHPFPHLLTHLLTYSLTDVSLRMSRNHIVRYAIQGSADLGALVYWFVFSFRFPDVSWDEAEDPGALRQVHWWHHPRVLLRQVAVPSYCMRCLEFMVHG